MKIIPKIVEVKEREHVNKKIPSFIHQRRLLYKKSCPPVKMQFSFKHKVTGEIHKVDCNSAPLKEFQRNPDYVKLYEEGHLQVNYSLKLELC